MTVASATDTLSGFYTAKPWLVSRMQLGTEISRDWLLDFAPPQL